MAIQLYDLAGAEEDRRFSPYCWRVKMALKHKGLEFETIAWHYTEKDAIAFSGQGAVPVLVDGGRAVHDSWDIALYLEQAYPSRPALFEGGESQALAQFFNHWSVRTLHPPLLRVIVLDVFKHVHPKDQPYFRASREKRFATSLENFGGKPNEGLADFRAALEPVRPGLVQNGFLSGKGPGFADYILFSVFQWARAVSPARLLERDDPLYAWRERMLDLFGGYARQAKGYAVWA